MAVVAALAAASPATAQLPCNGDPNLCDRTLDRVVLPATHNSMSNAAGGWQIPNQQVGIPAQLSAGVRGFLIDIYYAHRGADGKLVTDTTRAPGDQLYLCHVACSLGADSLYRAAARYQALPARPPPQRARLRQRGLHAARRTSPPRCGAAACGATSTGASWGRALADAAQADPPAAPGRDVEPGRHGPVGWYHNGYAGLLQETPYNWNTPNLLIDQSLWPASCQANRGGTTGDLFLMNHWSPPVAPKPATSSFVNATNVLVGRAHVCRLIRGRMPTLIAVDMFQSGGLFEAVRRLNAELN